MRSPDGAIGALRASKPATSGAKRSVSKLLRTPSITAVIRSRPIPVSMHGAGSGVRTPGSGWSNSMKTRFQISSQRSPSHSGPQSSRPQEQGPPQSQ